MKDIHKTSTIHPSAEIADHVSIGAFCTIGANVRIESNVVLGPHCVVEQSAHIGEHTQVAAFSFIGRKSKLLKKVIVQEGSVVGGIGYGYTQDASYNHIPIPQMGRVNLAEEVQLGARSVIDRAGFSETDLEAHTSVGSHSHIAHNLRVGKNTKIGSGVVIAGSTKIGSDCNILDQVSITGHKVIADNCNLQEKSVVHNHVKTSGNYAGHPLLSEQDQKSLMDTLNDQEFLQAFATETDLKATQSGQPTT